MDRRVYNYFCETVKYRLQSDDEFADYFYDMVGWYESKDVLLFRFWLHESKLMTPLYNSCWKAATKEEMEERKEERAEEDV